jgi:hypothetical protein
MDWLPQIEPYNPTITCELELTSLTLGDQVLVSGEIIPKLGIKEVTVFMRSSDGTGIVRNAVTDDEEAYTLLYTPIEGGTWNIESNWVGVSGYGGVTSDACPLQVTLPLIEPEPEPELVERVPKKEAHIKSCGGVIIEGNDESDTPRVGNIFRHSFILYEEYDFVNNEPLIPINQENIVFTFHKPQGGTVIHNTLTDLDGYFSFTYTFDEAGRWVIDV